MLKSLKMRAQVLKKNKIKLVALILICITIALMFTVLPFQLWMQSDALTTGITSIRGDSMTPTIQNNDILYVHPIEFERGEIVIANCPNTTQYASANDILLLKRIVGIPGDSIEITKEGVLINGILLEEDYIEIENETLRDTNDINEIVLSDGEYFLLGDNRVNSFDSRHVGAVHQTEFVYGLTTEPNEYTYQIWSKVAVVAVVNLIGVFALSALVFVLLTIDPKQKTQRKREVTKPKSGDDVSATAVDAFVERVENSKKPQPKSKKNQKKAERAQKRHGN
jgi:signal peptidase I